MSVACKIAGDKKMTRPNGGSFKEKEDENGQSLAYPCPYSNTTLWYVKSLIPSSLFFSPIWIHIPIRRPHLSMDNPIPGRALASL